MVNFSVVDGVDVVLTSAIAAGAALQEFKLEAIDLGSNVIEVLVLSDADIVL